MDLKKKSLEEAMQNLEAIVRQLEEGRIPLEDAMKAFEQGVALKKHCETILNDAKMKIEKITEDRDGGVAVESVGFE